MNKNKLEMILESRLPNNGSDPEFGIPEQKKFPLYDEKHVRSAIKFFNYADSQYKKSLANAIISRMRKYGISSDIIGDDNALKKYI